MITVAILINGQPLMARSAHRMGDTFKEGEHLFQYACDDGSIIQHAYNDGAVVLAKKLLDTIVTEAEI